MVSRCRDNAGESFSAYAQEKIVMRGLGPRIHDFGQAEKKLVDARTKSAHDDENESEKRSSATQFV
jgi:hypothetical protein